VASTRTAGPAPAVPVASVARTARPTARPTPPPPPPTEEAIPAPPAETTDASGSPRIVPRQTPREVPREEPREAPRERPTRVPTAQPTVKARTYAGTASLPSGKLELEGIVYSEANPTALINGRVLRPGGYVEGYTIVSIAPDRVELEGEGGARIVLTLK